VRKKKWKLTFFAAAVVECDEGKLDSVSKKNTAT